VIEFVCTCGKRLKVQDDLAGQPVRCPACEAAVRVPAPEDELSGPEALQAAIRDIQRNGAAGAPVAETADTPVDLDEAAKGLDALARTAGGGVSRPKRAATRAAGSSRGRKPARAAARKSRKPKPGPRQVQAPRSRASGGKSDAKRKQAMIVGGFAALGVLLIIVIVAVAMRDDPPPPAPPEETATYMPETEPQPTGGPYTGHQPGELFNHVPFDDEREGGDAGEGADGS
jgi:hypothetical protein